jgi:hypothetical protein
VPTSPQWKREISDSKEWHCYAENLLLQKPLEVLSKSIKLYQAYDGALESQNWTASVKKGAAHAMIFSTWRKEQRDLTAMIAALPCY